MKKVLFLLLLISTLVVPAQVNVFNDSTIYEVMDNQLHIIQTKLYRAVLNRKLRGYKDDSLTSYYSLHESKYLNSYDKYVKTKKGSGLLYNPYDSMFRKLYKNFNDSVGYSLFMDFYVPKNLPVLIDTDRTHCYLLDTNYTGGPTHYYLDSNYKDTLITVFFDPEDLKGINVYYLQTNKYNDNHRNYSIRDISVDCRFIAGSTGIEIPNGPLFYFKYEDLKPVITNKELNFISTFSNIFFGDKFKSNEHEFYQWKFYDLNLKQGKICKEFLKEVPMAMLDNFYTVFNDEHSINYFYQDSNFTKPLDHDSYNKLMCYDKLIHIYPDPNDPNITIDSFTRSKKNLQQLLITTKKAVGMITEKYGDKTVTIYMKRSDFYKRCQPWLAFVIKEYF